MANNEADTKFYPPEAARPEMPLSNHNIFTLAALSENLTRLALVPYFSGTLGFCLAGLRLPHAAYYFAISVIPASLIGQGILVFVAPVARRSSIGISEKDIIPFCAAALVLAVIVLGVLFLTAPGVNFTVSL